MRVALVILHADPARGGAERYTVDLAGALARRGHDVVILASAGATGSVEGVGSILFPVRSPTRAGRYRSFLDDVDAHLIREPYDIVHAMLPVRRCDVYHPHAGIAAGANGNWKTLFNPRRRRMAEVEREMLTGNFPPQVLVLSDYVKSFIREHYTEQELPDARMVKLFNAVDLTRFSPDTDGTKRMVAADPRCQILPDDVAGLFIAQDFKRKGLHHAIDALARLQSPRLKLMIVGGDKNAAEFAARARRLNMHFQIEFFGATTDPRPFYRAADFFVLPTRHDPCSLVVLEALAMAVPVISTRFNGACEIMRDGVQGFVLDDPADTSALTEAMRKMLDPALRTRMRQACLDLRPSLSYEHHLDQLLGVYGRIASQKGSSKLQAT